MGPRGLRRGRRAVTFVVAAVATLTLALPTAVGASTALPNCKTFSPTKIKSLIDGKQKLHFEGKFPHLNACAFLGHRQKNHYEMAVNIDVLPGSKSLFARLRANAQKVVAQQGGTFRVVSYSDPAEIKVSQVQSSAGLPACSPHEKVPVTGPPSCSSEPDWWHQDAWAYGTLKGTKTPAIVAVETYAELGDAKTDASQYLAKQILNRVIK